MRSLRCSSPPAGVPTRGVGWPLDRRIPRRGLSTAPLERRQLPQDEDLAPQLVLGLERLVELLALAMPALHRQVELRRLQPREPDIRADAATVERAQALAKTPPRAPQDVDLLGHDDAGAGRRLLAQLRRQSRAFAAQAEDEQHDHDRREGPGHRDRAQMDARQAEQATADGEEVEPRV